MGFKSSGFGLVKIIWRHGEKSGAEARFQVTREDVMRLPEIINDYLPRGTGSRQLNGLWSVPLDEKTTLVVVMGKRKGGAAPTVITMFRSSDLERYPFSPKRETPASPVRNTLSDHYHNRDTAAGASSSPSTEAGVSSLNLLAVKNVVNKESPALSKKRPTHNSLSSEGKIPTHIFARETPETFREIPSTQHKTSPIPGFEQLDAGTGLLPDEIMAARNVEMGTANKEAAKMLQAEQQAEITRQKTEEAGYAPIDHILKIKD